MHISKIVEHVKNEINFSQEFCEDNVFVTLRTEEVLRIIENLEQSHRDISEIEEENKKKDKIIDEQLKENVKLQTELNTENNRCMILANNNKFKEQMIDLMAEWISERCFYKDDYSNSCEIIQDSCNKEDDCKDCIKQYFENKAKKGE